MRKADVLQAEVEARRFLERLQAVTWRKWCPEATNEYPGPSGVETAALRRASLDLTRALARMRRP